MTLTLILSLALMSSSGRADDSDSNQDKVKGMSHRDKSGLDEDKLGELLDWETLTLEKLTGDPDMKPESLKARLLKERSNKDSAGLACVYLNLASEAEIMKRTIPSLAKFNNEEKDKWTDLGVLSKQVIGEQVIYKISDEPLEKLQKEYSGTRCGRLAVIEKMAFTAPGVNCNGKEYLDIIKQGTSFLKNKELSAREKSLTYYFMAKAYQTQWAMAFMDQTDNFNPQEYFGIHSQAKADMIKYYKLLEKEELPLRPAIEYLLKRIDEKVDLGADYYCQPEE